MANVISAKQIKIKPENAVLSQGQVIKVKYSGSSTTGIAFASKTTHYYKVYIQVQELPKALVLKVKEKTGWGNAVTQSIQNIGKSWGKNKPVNEGELIAVVYDKTKPKKCMVYEGQ
jgi:hypothetical protein